MKIRIIKDNQEGYKPHGIEIGTEIEVIESIFSERSILLDNDGTDCVLLQGEYEIINGASPQKMKIYYAHCQSLFGTPQEKRDIELLTSLGFDVVNPGDASYKDKVIEMKASGFTSGEIITYFGHEVERCDVLAFRALPDGAIPAGVAMEIKYAQTRGYPVIELPSSVQRRTISIDLTWEYLRESGQR